MMKKIDIFGIQPSLKVDGSDKLRTNFGGSLSLVFYLSTLGIFVFCSVVYFSKLKFSITSSQSTLPPGIVTTLDSNNVFIGLYVTLLNDTMKFNFSTFSNATLVDDFGNYFPSYDCNDTKGNNNGSYYYRCFNVSTKLKGTQNSEDVDSDSEQLLLMNNSTDPSTIDYAQITPWIATRDVDVDLKNILLFNTSRSYIDLPPIASNKRCMIPSILYRYSTEWLIDFDYNLDSQDIFLIYPSIPSCVHNIRGNRMMIRFRVSPFQTQVIIKFDEALKFLTYVSTLSTMIYNFLSSLCTFFAETELKIELFPQLRSDNILLPVKKLISFADKILKQEKTLRTENILREPDITNNSQIDLIKPENPCRQALLYRVPEEYKVKPKFRDYLSGKRVELNKIYNSILDIKRIVHCMSVTEIFKHILLDQNQKITLQDIRFPLSMDFSQGGLDHEDALNEDLFINQFNPSYQT